MFERINQKRMEISDKRGRKVNEIISGIKVIKFTAWEKIMSSLTKKLRSLEGVQILKAFTLYNLSHSISTMIPTLLAMAIFTLQQRVYNRSLSISTIYELINLFNSTLTPIRYYIMGVTGLSDSNVATRRMACLMQLEEQEPLGNDPELRLGEMRIKDGNFNWEDAKYHKIFEGKPIDKKKETNYILKDINLWIEPGDFVGVIGKVGAGKSSLLLSLMNEMVGHEQSKVQKNGDIAYISQEAFLCNDTI